MGKLSKEYDTLEQEHETTYAEFKTVREDLQRLWKVKSNIVILPSDLISVQRNKSSKINPKYDTKRRI